MPDPDAEHSCSPPHGADALSVGQLARAVGVTGDTVRFYEKVGLLPPPPRSAADHRRYDGSAVDRLRFIQGVQRLGLTLREVRTLLDVRDTGQCPCEPAHDLLREHVRAVDAELTRLVRLRGQLVAMADALPGEDDAPCPDPAPGTWLPRGGGAMEITEVQAEQCCRDGCCEGEHCEPGCC